MRNVPEGRACRRCLGRHGPSGELPAAAMAASSPPASRRVVTSASPGAPVTAHHQYPRGYTAKSYRQRALPGRTEVPSGRRRRIRRAVRSRRSEEAALLARSAVEGAPPTPVQAHSSLLPAGTSQMTSGGSCRTDRPLRLRTRSQRARSLRALTASTPRPSRCPPAGLRAAGTARSTRPESRGSGTIPGRA